MFKKHYIFETSATRSKRYLINACLSLVLFFLVYTICCFIFILVSNSENEVTRGSFFQKNPDLLVVFTGDTGRIPFALDKAKEYPSSQIFITGVYAKNSIMTLIAPLGIEGEIDLNRLEIDHFARNTVENVVATLRFMRKKKNHKTAMVISHDYHIMRIKIIVDKLMTEEDGYDFYYYGVRTDYTNFRNLKILYKEVFKLARTYLFLMLWDTGFSPAQN
jgi:uncharacterized SAM-binding protein YcdF (DUF218 family)